MKQLIYNKSTSIKKTYFQPILVIKKQLTDDKSKRIDKIFKISYLFRLKIPKQKIKKRIHKRFIADQLKVKVKIKIGLNVRIRITKKLYLLE